MVVLTEQQKIEKAARTTEVAFNTLADERRKSDAKIARLRAMRLEREALEAPESSVKKKLVSARGRKS
ncbi:MAG: hypothetical protein INR68_01260 [Methylobacterium mesophilicum]|nr:hypothetical protein [Methylobacterium mesophilicum]